MAVCDLCKSDEGVLESLCPVCREAIIRLQQICSERPELRTVDNSAVFFRVGAAAGERY